MPRVRAVEMDGLSLKISPLTYDEAEQYIKDGQAMLKQDPKPTEEEWAKRTLESVATALNKAANGDGGKWDIKKVASELDMVMINRIYKEFMDISGLGPAPKGEAVATSTSR